MFANDKKKCLELMESEDKSRKGSVDEQIKPLLLCINNNQNYYSTSSCAGRFLLIAIAQDEKKYNASWLYASHDTVSLEDIRKGLSTIPPDTKEIYFKCEAPILHVCCKDVDSALGLLQFARDLGLKRSGIISLKDERIIVELIGTLSFHVPLFAPGLNLTVSDDYLSGICVLARDKLQRSREQFDKLKESFRK